MTTVLITGFGPFPGAPVNPTGALVEALAKRRRTPLAGVKRVAHVFDTRYAAVDQDLPRLIKQYRPDAVLMFGLAGHTRPIRIERTAHNRTSTLLADAGGTIAASPTIDPAAPATLTGRADFPRLVQAARRAGATAELSDDAGLYLCNYAYWRALAAARQAGGPRSVVFIHVPRGVLPTNPRRALQSRHVSMLDLGRVGEALLLATVASVNRQTTPS